MLEKKLTVYKNTTHKNYVGTTNPTHLLAEDNKFTLLIWKRCSGCMSKMWRLSQPNTSYYLLVYDTYTPFECDVDY